MVDSEVLGRITTLGRHRSVSEAATCVSSEHGVHSDCTARFFLAANDSYGLIFAVCPRNRHGLRDARRSTDDWVEGWFRRVRKRRTSMHPIPGNIVGACVYPVRDRLPDV